MRTLLAVLLLPAFVLQPALLHARAQAEEPALPLDERENWRVGVLPFDALGLSPEEVSLTRSIPLTLLETLTRLREHRLSEAERDARRRRVLEAALLNAGRAVDREVRARDRLLFADITAQTRRERLEAADRRVADARAEYRRLESIDPGRIEIAAAKPIEVRPAAGELLRAAVSPRAAAREHQLDFVISGTIERLDDEFLVLEVFGYNSALDHTLLHDTEVFRPEQIFELLDGVAGRAAEVVLGRPWASLIVHASDPDAAVLVDGMLYGFGSVSVSFLEPGPRRVVVSHEDRELSRTVVLLPFEQAVVELEFPAAEAGSIAIESEPPGADVYINSVWSGRTPTEVPRPAQTATMLLEMDGYHGSRTVLGPASPDLVSRRLAPDIVGWGEQTRAQRDRFYRGLGFFVVSLPLPIILSGVYNNLYTFSVEDSDPVDPARLDTILWAYRGSVGVSAGLFVNMAVQLIRYIRTAESYHFH